MLASSPTVVTVLLLFSAVSALDSVSFFYSPVVDSCEWGASNTFGAANNTQNGGVCAFIPSKNRLYACPAPDPTCWAWFQNCKGGTNTPTADQILCGPSTGIQWCCAGYETCTELQEQVNVCVSSFDSPNRGVSRDEARRKEYSAIPPLAFGTAFPQGTPTPFSTILLGSSTTSSTSSTTSVSSTSSTAAATSVSRKNESDPVVSDAAIAGIVVGAIATIAIISGTIIFLVVHKRRLAAKSRGFMEGYDGRGKPADYSPTYDGRGTSDFPISPCYQFQGYRGADVNDEVVVQGELHELPALGRLELPESEGNPERPVLRKELELPS